MSTIMNIVAVLLHVLDFVSGLNGSKGIILDFIGQCECLHSSQKYKQSLTNIQYSTSPFVDSHITTRRTAIYPPAHLSYRFIYQ